MNEKYFITGVLLTVLVTSALMPLTGTKINEPQGITYHSSVCKVVTRADGRIENLGCNHNVVNNGGLNFIRDCVGNGLCGAPTAFRQMAIANCTTTPAAAHTVLCNAANNEWTTCGLANATSTYYQFGTGAWNVSYQWTSSCDTAYVNATGLYNATQAGTLLASNTFTSVTLMNGDKLNVTWGIWVA